MRKDMCSSIICQVTLKIDTFNFNRCLEIDPNNAAAKTQLAICTKALQEQLKKEKKIYANMFDKFAKMDTQVKAN